MKKFPCFYVPYVIIVLFSSLQSICGRMFGANEYYPANYYEGEQEHNAKINAALTSLKHEPEWLKNWPDSSVQLGQVSAVALDNKGRVVVFHRASNVWDATTFTEKNVYRNIGNLPIPHPTVVVFNDTGEVVDMWGQNLFHMPHGITVDSAGNVWMTDVALHQVFKFTPNQRQKPALVLGEKFEPGDDDAHFCKPSAVAVLSDGHFFVADGYCNSRIIKYAPDGTNILQWGMRHGQSQYSLSVPHALSLAEDRGVVLVADREHGRVAIFKADNGTFVATYKSWLIGPRVFSVAYSPVHGGRIYLVNGPGGEVPVRGYVIDYTTGKLIQTFAPEGDFTNPHDVVTSPDGTKTYVAEINPYKVYKFVDESLRNETRAKSNVTLPVKPTATVEVNASLVNTSAAESWRSWPGAGAAGAGAGGAALLALAALALLRARNNGKRHVSATRVEAEPLVQ